MEKIRYDEIKADLEKQGEVFVSDEVKDIRWSMSKLMSDIQYYDYQIFIRRKAYDSLNKEYLRLIGASDETTKNV